MTDIKSRIQQHFFTRKNHFIINKPPLSISFGKEYFDITTEFTNGRPHFRVDHGVASIYFTSVDDIAAFIEKHKDTK